QIYETTAQRFEVVRRLMRREAWDFFMFVEMGVDRIHHGFWRFFDEKHPKHEPGNPYQHAIRDYYRAIDREIGTLLALLDNDTSVMVVSDHGARTMLGGICVNEWLRREGYLALAGKPPASPTALDKLQVDWSRTRAWGEGGYYARVFLNVAGREPQGVVKPKDYERVRDEVAAGLKAIRGPRGEDLGTVIYKPHDIYRKVRGIPPDLLVYFGDLAWRSVGSLGHSEVWTLENDTGPDEANHARDGLFIYADPQRNLGGRELEGLEIMDVASTILAHYGLSVPGDMQGRRIAL
ncbi:MAG TPA: alkaline phosphatase family protein, partial [Anaerolineales bacterium]|nr:alkaline phosphatase family protein [Anaerolineales bacterium]